MSLTSRHVRILGRAGVLLALALATVACAFIWPSPSQAAPFATITGVATDASNSIPVAGARVELWTYDDQATYSWVYSNLAITDSLGTYSFAPSAEGYYALKFKATGYSDVTFDTGGGTEVGFWVSAGQTVTRNASMSPLAPAIAGRLRGPTGADFSQADVTLYRSMNDSETVYWGVVETARTRANGTWAFYSLPAGVYRVGFHPDSPAYLDEYFDDAATVGAATDIAYSPPTSLTGYDATLSAAPRSIAGTATAGGGSPVAGCVVNAYHWVTDDVDPDLSGWYLVAQTTTAADGSYAFYSLPYDVYHVGFSKPGFGSEYYSDKATVETADDVSYAGMPLDGISVVFNTYAPDTFEPDGTALLASALVVGAAPQQHTLAPDPDEDWATFTAAAGHAYSIETTYADSSATDTYLELYAADGVSLLGADNDSNGDGFSALSFIAETDGAVFVRVRGASAGTVGAYGVRVVEVPDTAPPSVVSDAQESYAGTATIHIAAVDARSSIAYVSWRLDGGSTQTVAATSTTVQTTSVGEHSLVFWAADTAGNVAPARTATFTVTAQEPPPAGDTTPPAVSTDATASYVGTATIAVSAEDTGSGVVQVSYRLDSETTVTASGPSAVVTTSVLGAHTLRASAVDASGNVAPAVVETFTVVADVPPPPVDTTPPSVTASVSPTSVGTATVTLTATDASSAVASVSWRLNGTATQTVADANVQFSVTAVGTHSLEYWAADTAGNVSPPQTVGFTVTAPPAPDVVTVQVAGATRYQTALLASQLAYPDGLNPAGARTVVIATGANWPDALGGATLAGALDGPILLTTPTELAAGVADEIDRLGADFAIVLGGTGAVSAGVESQLKALLGTDAVERIGGATRYQTAELVAVRARETLGWAWDGTVLIATGASFPDALAAAPLAAGFGWPLLLESPSGLTQASKAFIENSSAPASGAVILGGTGAVSAGTQAYLGALLGTPNTVRLAGLTRYETAAEIASYGVDNGFSWDGVAIATGQNFPDALAGGVLQGAAGSVMLLTPSATLDPAARAVLVANAPGIFNVTYLGGDGAVSPAVRAAVEDALR